MTDKTPPSKCPMHMLTRRSLFKAVGGLGLFAAGAASGVAAKNTSAAHGASTVAFRDKVQGGILTPQQAHTYFAAFDINTNSRDELIQILKDWTNASAEMTSGKLGDSALGLAPSRLTMTFGFGADVFSKGGKDRFGIGSQKPEALVDMPLFHGDQLIPEKTGGDISVQACSDDPQIAFHAIRQIVKLAGTKANIRWSQTAFVSGNGKETPRNLQGFKDGTQNPQASEMNQFVFVGGEGPAWFQGGTYLVTRRIRIALEHWDGMDVDYQEQVIGRHKLTGAPLGMKNEFDKADLKATNADGNLVIGEHSHLRLAAAESNGGSQILRRGYSYNDGSNFTAERWPPWRQGVEYDAGLFFVAYQKDPRDGFIRIFGNMAKFDMLNQFTTHVGSGMFAVPPGARDGEFIGQKLFA